MGSDGSAAGGGGKRPERVAAVGEGRRRAVAEDIRRAPQQEARLRFANTKNNLNIYPGVAQLVARLLWEQDAASSSLATWTKSPESAFAESGLFCLCSKCRSAASCEQSRVPALGQTRERCRRQIQRSAFVCSGRKNRGIA